MKLTIDVPDETVRQYCFLHGYEFDPKNDPGKAEAAYKARVIQEFAYPETYSKDNVLKISHRLLGLVANHLSQVGNCGSEYNAGLAAAGGLVCVLRDSLRP